MNLEMRHVRAILAIAEEGNLTRASSRLGIPQSALSTQLQRIERTVGTVMFVRTSQGMSHSDGLARLLPYLRSADAAMRGLEEAIDGQLLNYFTPLHFGLASPDFADAADAIRGCAPDAPADFVISSADTCVHGLYNERLDFVLLSGPLSVPSAKAQVIRSVTVATETLCALLPSGHPLGGRSVVGLAELAGERWVSYPLRGEEHDVLAKLCQMYGFQPHVTFTAATELAARELVRDHGCVTVGSQSAARAGICVRPLDVHMTRRFTAAWRTSCFPPSFARVLCTSLRRWYEAKATAAGTTTSGQR